MCDINFPRLVASLFSWRCLAVSTSYFLHATMNLRLPSVTVSTHTSIPTPSLSNPPLCQTPGCRSISNRSALSPSHLVLSAMHPQGFRKRFALWQPPAADSDERPRPQKYSRAQRCLTALAPGYLEGTVVRGHPMVWSLALCPDNVKQDRWCTVRSLA